MWCVSPPSPTSMWCRVVLGPCAVCRVPAAMGPCCGRGSVRVAGRGQGDAAALRSRMREGQAQLRERERERDGWTVRERRCGLPHHNDSRVCGCTGTVTGHWRGGAGDGLVMAAMIAVAIDTDDVYLQGPYALPNSHNVSSYVSSTARSCVIATSSQSCLPLVLLAADPAALLLAPPPW